MTADTRQSPGWPGRRFRRSFRRCRWDKDLRWNRAGIRFAKGFSRWWGVRGRGSTSARFVQRGLDGGARFCVSSGRGSRRAVGDLGVEFGSDQAGHGQRAGLLTCRRFEIPVVEGHKQIQAGHRQQGEDGAADGISSPSHRRQNRLGLLCSRAWRLPRRLKNMTVTARTITGVAIWGRGRQSRTASSGASHGSTFRPYARIRRRIAIPAAPAPCPNRGARSLP
jgi:hypothetical protein